MVNLAFMIRIEEFPKWEFPSRKHTCMQNLHSQPFHHAYNNYIPALPLDALDPVVVEEFTWISITCVTFELYLYRPNGPLVVNSNLQDDYLACGVHIYPTVDMKNDNLLLSKASDHLIQFLISDMEVSQEDVWAIKQICWSKARLMVFWHIVLQSFWSAMFIAAHKHYTDWHRSGKHKLTTADFSCKKSKNGSEDPQLLSQQAFQDKCSG